MKWYIMNNIEIKPLKFDPEQIKKLYLDNKWYAYTNDLDSLYQGILNSTESIGAYEGNTLLGLIRVVSDKHTICFIQDILVLEEYHRDGIGTLLMNQVIEKYQQCRQITLHTDNSEKTHNFYKKLGFKLHTSDELSTFSYIQKASK